jgi:SAM-dependent methyltransferase
MSWFASWFDSSHYHSLYAHRSDREAAAFVDALLCTLRPPAGARALDLGCGAGRHARRLAERSLRVTGLDLSARSIARARQFQQPGLTFRRHDMRAPFGTRKFDYVFNLFTSFGYFESDAEHFRVVDNIARALTPGGTVVVDYLNVRNAETRLVREEVMTTEAAAYRLTRWTDARHFYKRVQIEEPNGTRQEFVERVARLRLADFHGMFSRAGLRLRHVFGDYALSPFDDATSPRLILVAAADGAPGERPARRLAARTASGPFSFCESENGAGLSVERTPVVCGSPSPA